MRQASAGSGLDRRRLLQRVGGAAALAALGRTGFTIGGQRPGRGDDHHVGQPPRVERPDARDPGGIRGRQSRHHGRVHRYPGPRLPRQAANGGRRRQHPPTSSARWRGAIITQVAAGGELPFIDLTGKIDVSGLTDTARGQVEVDGKVYGTPLASYTVGIAYPEADLRRARAGAADDLAGAEGRRPGAARTPA